MQSHATTRNPDTLAAEHFLTFVYQQGDLIEVRGLGTRVARHLSRDIRSLAATATALEARDRAVFYTLNPIRAESHYAQQYAEAKPMLRAKRTATDPDISCRNLYLVDVDPVRPAGTSSTDAEKAEALTVAKAVQTRLTSLGWPEPVVVDSGNGYHLLYRADRCNADNPVWAHVLRHLAAEYDTEHAHIDTAVHNAARIARLPGMVNRKGEHTPERPHRRAAVISYPPVWTPVRHEQVFALATEGGFSIHGDRSRVRKGSLAIDHDGVMRLIDEFAPHLSLRGVKEADDATYYILDHCPLAGRKHSGACDKTALVLGEEHFGFKCLSDDCDGHGWQALKIKLHELTGRWPSMRIYTHEDEGFDDWMMARGEYQQRRTPEWQHDAKTYAALDSDAFRTRTWSTHPDAYSLSWHDLRHYIFNEAQSRIAADPTSAEAIDYEAKATAIYSGHDLAAAGELLGAEYLFVLARAKAGGAELSPYPKGDGRIPGLVDGQALTALQALHFAEERRILRFC